jgi:hypothetical protein
MEEEQTKKLIHWGIIIFILLIFININKVNWLKCGEIMVRKISKIL